MAVRHRPRTGGGAMPNPRPSGRRVPGASRRAERLHRPRHPGHEGRGIGLFGGRGSPAVSRFVQQSLSSPALEKPGASAQFYPLASTPPPSAAPQRTVCRNTRGVNIGRRLPRLGGQFCTPRHTVVPFPVECGTSTKAISAPSGSVFGQRSWVGIPSNRGSPSLHGRVLLLSGFPFLPSAVATVDLCAAAPRANLVSENCPARSDQSPWHRAGSPGPPTILAPWPRIARIPTRLIPTPAPRSARR